MTRVCDIEKMLYDWAPRDLALEWDNVGLLVGDSGAEVRKVLVSLDVTEAVAAEAVAIGADLIVAHHPLMNCAWHKVQHVTTDDAQGRTITTLLKNNVSAICMHTNLDAAEGGVNDALAEKLGLQATKPLTDEKIGRVGTLNCEKPLVEFLQDVIKYLGCNGLRYVDCGRPVHRVAVGGGACGDYIGQAIALCPGVSRSGMTITTGCFVGFDRKFAVRFSFLLSIPAVLGANILTLKDAIQENSIIVSDIPVYLVGVAVAAVVGYICIRLLKMIADKGKFGWFAYYCWAVGLIVLALTLVLK